MKRRFLRTLSAIMAVVILTFSCMVSVYATTGSITVTVKYDNIILTDGVFTIYKVADIDKNLIAEFANSGITIGDMTESTSAFLLWAWAINTGISGESRVVESDGTVTFSNLDEGIYLVVPSVNSVGYEVTPSLVPVPLNGEYDVGIEPKIEPTTTPYTPTDPTPTTTTTEPDEDVPIDEDDEDSNTEDEVELDEEEPEVEEETLPKTGQLNYPIPIMAGAGAFFVAAGFIVTKTDKTDKKK